MKKKSNIKKSEAPYLRGWGLLQENLGATLRSTDVGTSI